MEKLLYFPGKYFVSHAITASNVHSPITVLYLLKKGLLIISLILFVILIVILLIATFRSSNSFLTLREDTAFLLIMQRIFIVLSFCCAVLNPHDLLGKCRWRIARLLQCQSFLPYWHNCATVMACLCHYGGKAVPS